VVPDDHFLLPTQRNEVLRLIRESPLEPADFDWRQTRTAARLFGPGWEIPKVPLLAHRPSEAAFAFDWDGRNHVAIYVPGETQPEDRYDTVHWSQMLDAVSRWLVNTAREYQAPDLWRTIRRGSALAILPPPDADNAPFSDAERELIADHLRMLEERLTAEFELAARERTQLRQGIERLTEATKRLGRLDWRQVLLAELVTLVVQRVLLEPAFQVAVDFLTGTLGHLFGHGGGPLAPGLLTPPA
jgi:hypothetical protein